MTAGVHPDAAHPLLDARTRRARSGAARVVVVKLDEGGVPIWDYRDEEITMTKDTSSANLIAEIRAAHGLSKKPAR